MLQIVLGDEEDLVRQHHFLCPEGGRHEAAQATPAGCLPSATCRFVSLVLRAVQNLKPDSAAISLGDFAYCLKPLQVSELCRFRSLQFLFGFWIVSSQREKKFLALEDRCVGRWMSGTFAGAPKLF